MWLDASQPTLSLAALAPLPFGALHSAAASPGSGHVLLRTRAAEVVLADTAYSIPEQLPRLTKQVGATARGRVRACAEGSLVGSKARRAHDGGTRFLGVGGEFEEQEQEGEVGGRGEKARPRLTQQIGSAVGGTEGCAAGARWLEGQGAQ